MTAITLPPPTRLSQSRHRPADRAGGSRNSWLLTVIMMICVCYFLFPLFWLVVASTKSNADLFSTFGLWFADFNLIENIKTVLTFQDGVFVRGRSTR